MIILRRNYFNELFNDLFNSGYEFGSQFPKDDDTNFNKEVEEVETETHVIKKETWKSLDGNTIYKRSFMESKSKQKEEKLEDLKSELKLAIDSEDFEKAIELRDRIKKIGQ